MVLLARLQFASVGGMPTLYVRNVPEDLYERLRAQAEAHGRPIGGEALRLLADQLPPGTRRGLRRRRADAPFSHLGPAARAVIVQAKEEASARGHAYLGTEHLLLGVLAQTPIPGLELDTARGEIDRLAGPGSEGAKGEPPFTARAKQALDLAVKAAGSDPVEPTHIAIGLIGEGGGIAAQVLARAGVDVAALRLAPAPPPFRVIDLGGDAEAWSAALNGALADADYELAGVFGGRAVLRRP
jgi:plasmid stability protein